MAKFLDMQVIFDGCGQRAVLDRELPFAVKAVFSLSGVKGRYVAHRRRKARLVFVALAGRCRVAVGEAGSAEVFTLTAGTRALLLEPADRRELYDFSEDCLLFVLASVPEDAADLLPDFPA